MKKNVYIVILLCAIPTYFVQAQTFTRPLSTGLSGEDVKSLQILLNKNLETQIAFEGAGAPGYETNYFGELTKQAVIKLQNKHAHEILTPVGLSIGTGFVGQSTLNFLNSLQIQINSVESNFSAPETSTVQNISSEQSASNPPQFFISATKALAGDDLYVGSQTDISNTNFYLDTSLLKKKCYTDFTCELSIDKKTETGLYILSTDNSSLGQAQIHIFDSKTKRPEVALKKLSLKETNLIKGKNFTEKMTVYTLYGIFETKTLNDSFVLNFSNTSTGSTTPVTGPFYLENENGLASDILDIQYEI